MEKQTQEKAQELERQFKELWGGRITVWVNWFDPGDEEPYEEDEGEERKTFTSFEKARDWLVETASSYAAYYSRGKSSCHLDNWGIMAPDGINLSWEDVEWGDEWDEIDIEVFEYDGIEPEHFDHMYQWITSPERIVDTEGLTMEEWSRRCTAQNPDTPADVLRELAGDDDERVQENVASNPSTPADALADLANGEYKVRVRVALNKNAPTDTLRELAKDKDERIRKAVAQNANTPEDALRELANDDDLSVKYSLSENKNTPKEILPTILAELATSKARWNKVAAAENPATPPDVLRKLAQDKSRKVREAVAGNDSTPEDVAKELEYLLYY